MWVFARAFCSAGILTIACLLVIAGAFVLGAPMKPADQKSQDVAKPAAMAPAMPADRLDSAGPIRLAAVDPAAAVTLAPVDRPPSRSEESNEPFGLTTLRAPEGLLWEKWRGIEAEIRAEANTLARCRIESESCSLAAVRFLALIEAGRMRSGRARFGEINRAVNGAIRYVGDPVQHGVADRWSSPLATFAAGRGDCEDYAIAKYVALREAGVAEGDLRLILVHDRAVREDHLVLAARHDGRWLILDNRRLTLLEANELPQYAPMFALNHEGVMLLVTAAFARASGGHKTAAPATVDGTAAVSSGSNGAPLLL
jgi:predicted transglutaminase-like cysteine proteinase